MSWKHRNISRLLNRNWLRNISTILLWIRTSDFEVHWILHVRLLVFCCFYLFSPRILNFFNLTMFFTLQNLGLLKMHFSFVCSHRGFGVRRCMGYLIDYNSPKKWQWFDVLPPYLEVYSFPQIIQSIFSLNWINLWCSMNTVQWSVAIPYFFIRE